MILTDYAIKNAKAGEKNRKMFDSGGLYIIITTQGSKWWRINYYYAGKTKTLSLGIYPTISLKEARMKRDEIKYQLSQGIDPSALRKKNKLEVVSSHKNTFQAVAEEWFDVHLSQKKPSYSKKVISLFKRCAFPYFGAKPIAEVDTDDLLKAANLLVQRKRVDASHRLITLCGQLFKYAILTRRLRDNFASALHQVLPHAKVKHMAALTNKKRIGQLLLAIHAHNASPSIMYAMRLAPLVFVRPNELRHAEWSEFDLDERQWTIPGHKMKMGKPHIVPLADQALAIIQSARQYSAASKYLFPSLRSNERPISEESLLGALRTMGFGKEEMTVHGFRGMASTLLNELGYERDCIELQLAHSERDQVRDAYNHAERLPQRKKMMQEWADYLDKLRDGQSSGNSLP